MPADTPTKESTSDAAKREHDLIYGLEDKPAPLQAFYAAVQHLLAMFVGIMTPAIIISGALGLSIASAKSRKKRPWKPPPRAEPPAGNRDRRGPRSPSPAVFFPGTIRRPGGDTRDAAPTGTRAGFAHRSTAFRCTSAGCRG